MQALRSTVAALSRSTPPFRGKGRVIVAADALLSRVSGTEACGSINGVARMYFDLEAWGQKFAYYYGEWEPDLVRWVRRLYAGGDFVDVGSSLGLYVVCVGELVRRAGAVIHSIEPVDFNLARQRRNIDLNGLRDIVMLHELAVGHEDSQIRISVDPTGHDNNAIPVSEGGRLLPMTTLDKLMQRAGVAKVGFLKMDVEGFEPRVVEGARGILERDRPFVLAEFNRERMDINGFEMGPSWSLFESLGYTAFEASASRLVRLRAPGRVENIFFLPPGTPTPA